MQFFNPAAFELLWGIAIFFLFYVIAQKMRKSKIEKIGFRETVQLKLMPQYRKSEAQIKFLCLCIVLLFSILALARPQWGDEKRTVKRKGIDIVFLLDTSLSMLAEDSKPNRFKKSKIEIKSFIRKLKGDRVGMVAFAGTGFLQTPLTLDYAAFLLFLDSMKVGYIPYPGTSMDKAIQYAVGAFPEEETKYKAMIVFSDGEDHLGQLDKAISMAKKNNIRVYTIGLGSATGEPIPLKDDQGRRVGFKKDRSGNIVVTKLNDTLLKQVAEETGGLYFPSTPGEQEIDYILKHLSSLGQKDFKEREITEKEDHYQLFIFIAFLFLLLEMLVRRSNPVAKSQTSSVVVFIAFLSMGFLENPTSLNNKGNELYEKKKYESAIESYRKAQVKEPDDSSIRYNLGTTLHRMDDYQNASKELQAALQNTEDPELLSKIYYNYGNTQYRLGNFEEAIDSYKKALEYNPEDKDSKYNLEFVQKQKSRFQQDNPDQQNQDQDENEQDQDQQQQDNQDQENQDQNEQNQDQQQDNQSQDQNQDQNEQNQDQQQQDNQNQDNQDKNQQNQGQNQDQKQDQDPQEDAQQQDSQNNQNQEDQQEEQNQQPNQGQEDQQDKQQREEERDQEQNKGGGQEEKEKEQQGGGGQHSGQQQRKPLQGQMSQEQAMRILDALKEGERDLQDLRRPGDQEDIPYVEKDW